MTQDDEKREAEIRFVLSEGKGNKAALDSLSFLLAQLDAARAEIVRLTKLVERDIGSQAFDDLEKELTEARAEIQKLKQERTTYRTLNSLMGDNGQLCEMHDELDESAIRLGEVTTERDEALARLKIARVALERVRRESNCLIGVPGRDDLEDIAEEALREIADETLKEQKP